MLITGFVSQCVYWVSNHAGRLAPYLAPAMLGVAPDATVVRGVVVGADDRADGCEGRFWVTAARRASLVSDRHAHVSSLSRGQVGIPLKTGPELRRSGDVQCAGFLSR